MFIGTHALLPVCLALTSDDLRLAARREESFPEWSIPLIAVFGALPDICTPHLSLDARYSSWSHTLAFLAGLIPVCFWVARYFPKDRRLLIACACWFASALHLAADAIAGGIPWLMPWVMPEVTPNHRTGILGDFYIHPNYWIFSDAFFVVLTWILLGIRAQLRRLI
ncbi:metal-dependent hydrolase [Haloferula sp.]|uniref:metal-dependent hydrolase n=1 Tax=Haloferula sp. TaxID=2497595 RepID=UPI003C7951E1